MVPRNNGRACESDLSKITNSMHSEYKCLLKSPAFQPYPDITFIVLELFMHNTTSWSTQTLKDEHYDSESRPSRKPFNGSS